MKKIFVSDFDEIQNMQSLWPKDITHKIWVELETKNFLAKKGPPLWIFARNSSPIYKLIWKARWGLGLILGI